MNKLITLLGLVVLIQICIAENPRYDPRYKREATPERYAENPRYEPRYKREATPERYAENPRYDPRYKREATPERYAENPRYEPRYKREATPDRYAAETPSKRYKRSAIRRGRFGAGRRGVRVNDNGRVIRKGRRVQTQPQEQEVNFHYQYLYEPSYYFDTPIYGPGPSELDCSCKNTDCGHDEFESGDCPNDEKRCCKFD
ncbi:uncharacterized protein LOC133205069 [Saccostrea echinata]|uniref:uncharacterized protein LOC133205069 n=1 Tax=Saccostrea echinata TaxID=191078 RepID=UPI002A827369|nr:uncharacterized protein LOC133205069 [Saccostrea echinata]